MPPSAAAHRRLALLHAQLSAAGTDRGTAAALPARSPLAREPALGSGCAVLKTETMHIDRASTQGGGTSLVFVKITADDGTVGWGEATNSGRNLATAEAVGEAARYLEGKVR